MLRFYQKRRSPINRASKAVDGRAKAVQLSVVDSRIVDVGWLRRNRSLIRHEGWLVFARGCVAVGYVRVGLGNG